MKRVAIINSVYSFGSTGRLSKTIAQHLNDNGNKCFVFYGRGKRVNDGIGIKFGTTASFLTHALLSRLFDCSGFLSSHQTRKLIKRLDDFKPDVVLINNLHGYYLNISLLLDYLAKSQAKSIFVLHDCWNMTGHCSHFTYVKCDKWKTGCNKCPNKKEYPASYCLDRSNHNYLLKKAKFNQINNATFISPCFWLSDILSQSYLSNHRCVVINNGIDLNTFNTSSASSSCGSSDEKIVLCVSNIWNARKGLNDIYKISKLLPNNYKVVIVGKVKKKSKIVKDNISFIKQTDNVDALVDLYRSSDVMFNPTYEDTFPTVDIEAIACGLPVVSYDTGGTSEIIKAQYCVEKGNIEEAIQKIINVVEDGKSDYVFNDVSQFSSDKMIKSYIELINEICSKEENEQ